jgi:trigger factor
MKIDFQRLDDLNARIQLVIGQEDYAPKMQELIAGYARKVQLKGFRAGKTPKSVLQRMYGKGLLEEAVTSILQDKLYGYLDEHKISYFASPMAVPGEEPLVMDPKNPSDYTFTFELGLKPTVEVRLDNEAAIDLQVPAPDLSGIDDQMIRYRAAFGDHEELKTGTVEAEDKVQVDLVRLGQDGQPAGEPEETEVDLARMQGSANVLFPGKSVGDTLEVDLEEMSGLPRKTVLGVFLAGIDDPAPDHPLACRLTITGIRRPQRTPLTGEQISRFVGRDIADEAAFREMLVEEERTQSSARANDLKKMIIRDRIIKANPFDMPEEFLLRWVNSQREEAIAAGSRQAEDFFRDARWSFLLNRILEQHQLEVTEKDINQQMYQWIFRNLDYRNADIRKTIDQLRANEYFMSTMKEQAMEEVVFAHVTPLYAVQEQEVAPAVFDETAHRMYHVVFGMGDHDHGEHDHAHGGDAHAHAESH